MKKSLFLLALASGLALADGVTLIAPGTAAPPSGPQIPNLVKMHPITLNKAAFGSSVLTVVIDGQQYRFVGSMMPAAPPLTAQQIKNGATRADTQSWAGTGAKQGEQLVLTKSGNEVSGTIYLPPARSFWFTSNRPVLIETDRGNIPAPQLVAPPAPPAPSASGVLQ